MFVCPSRRLGFSKPFIGEIITFDQLALRAPTGKNTLLLQGKLDLVSWHFDDEKTNLDERNDFQIL